MSDFQWKTSLWAMFSGSSVDSRRSCIVKMGSIKSCHPMGSIKSCHPMECVKSCHPMGCVKSCHPELPTDADVANHVIPMQYAVKTIVSGYNRRFRINIPEIDNLCTAYYGPNVRKLIHFREHGNWFSMTMGKHPILKRDAIKIKIDRFAGHPSMCSNDSLKKGLKLNLQPLSQYIVENVQIAYGYIKERGEIKWSGFLYIDLRTRSFRELRCKIKNKPVKRDHIYKLTVSLFVWLCLGTIPFRCG